MSNYAFGIDLGTTNSCIAVKVPGQPATTITLQDGKKTLASCVMFKDGKVTVGAEAYANRYDTKHVVYSSKRDIGSDRTYTIYANGDDKPPVEITPVQVATEILKKLKHDAELIYGNDFIKDVTITVPAYFTLARRAATIEAATLAGLNVLALINEPTSAAIAYTEGKTADEKILVYDLGGGTFDVTLLEMMQPSSNVASLFDENILDSMLARVIASAGDDHLGGDDLDRATYYEALSTIERENLPDDLQEIADHLDDFVVPDSRERAILTIEQNKKRGIGSTLSTFVVVNYKGVMHHVPFGVSKRHYENAFRPIYAKTILKLNECIGSRDIRDINKLILIGGSTKLEYLRQIIGSSYPNTRIYTNLNPDEAVALGAAVNSSILLGQTAMTVSDVLPQSIGIKVTNAIGNQTFEGKYYCLISKNTSLPATVHTTVTTDAPYQSRAVVPIYQGEDSLADNNTHVSDVVLSLDPTEEIQDISVTMVIDASGILHVRLESKSTVASAEIENILKPTANNKSKLEKLVTRYRLILGQYPEDIQARGTELLDDFVEKKTTFAEVREFFDELTKNSFTSALAGIDEAARTDEFGQKIRTITEEEEDEDEDDDDCLE